MHPGWRSRQQPRRGSLRSWVRTPRSPIGIRHCKVPASYRMYSVPCAPLWLFIFDFFGRSWVQFPPSFLFILPPLPPCIIFSFFFLFPPHLFFFFLAPPLFLFFKILQKNLSLFSKSQFEIRKHFAQFCNWRINKIKGGLKG